MGEEGNGSDGEWESRRMEERGRREVRTLPSPTLPLFRSPTPPFPHSPTLPLFPDGAIPLQWFCATSHALLPPAGGSPLFHRRVPAPVIPARGRRLLLAGRTVRATDPCGV